MHGLQPQQLLVQPLGLLQRLGALFQPNRPLKHLLQRKGVGHGVHRALLHNGKGRRSGGTFEIEQ